MSKYTDFGRFGVVVVDVDTCVFADPDVVALVFPGATLFQVGDVVPLALPRDPLFVASRFRSKFEEDIGAYVAEIDLALVTLVNV